jgi:type VI secretion system secreted protein VgrG
MSVMSQNLTSSSTVFHFEAESVRGEALLVPAFRGVEALSRPFSFDVSLAVPVAVASFTADVLGARARLILRGSVDRVIAGVVTRVTPEGAAPAREHFFHRVRLVPQLRLLAHTRTSRIFQDLSVPDIVRAVLRDAAIPCSWKTSRPYPSRVYCVQYRESSLDFIHRLLAEEGIFYTFDHPAADVVGPEVVTFADGPEHYHSIEGGERLRFVDAGEMRSAEHVRRFGLSERVSSGATLLRSFDFRRPGFDGRAEARVPVGNGHADDGTRRVYEHDGDVQEQNVEGPAARGALEQERRKARLATGESSCRRLVPGGLFTLEEHPVPELNARYAVVRVEHRGRQPISFDDGSASTDHLYENRFRCVPGDAPFRPSRLRRPLQQVTETATVVGPPGEEIHVDTHGRIKVQFHWDLEGRHDERSSCWMRAMHPWSGAAWGSQFIPRVGMEVVVTWVQFPLCMGKAK